MDTEYLQRERRIFLKIRLGTTLLEQTLLQGRGLSGPAHLSLLREGCVSKLVSAGGSSRPNFRGEIKEEPSLFVTHQSTQMLADLAWNPDQTKASQGHCLRPHGRRQESCPCQLTSVSSQRGSPPQTRIYPEASQPHMCPGIFQGPVPMWFSFS